MHAILITAALGLWQPALAGEPDAPEALVADALASNPALEGLAAGIQALEARAAVAGVWSDPAAMVEYSNVPLDGLGLAGHPMAGLQLKVQQRLHLSGTPGAQQALGEARVEDAALARQQRAEQLARELRSAYWQLAAVRQDRTLTERHVGLLDELITVVRARYETGSASQSALLELELRRARLSDALEDRDRDERRLLAVVNQALHRSPASPIATPTQIPVAEPTGDAAAWLEAALASSPALAELEARAHTARLEAELARAAGRPDPTVWAGYRLRTVQTDMDPGTDLVSLGLSVPIPVASQRRADGTQASAEHRAAALVAQRLAAVDSVASQLTAAEASWSRATALLTRTQDVLIPSATRTLDAVLTDYRVGRAGFDALIRAELELLALERTAIGAAATTQLQHAAVLALTGTGATGTAP
jgi:outer membrane protein, heavy metal efflux system